jgi:hypothetical protein
MVTLLTLGSVVVLGHTQWWVPREQARQKAQVTYEHCLDEVQVSAGTHSHHDRLAQRGNLRRGRAQPRSSPGAALGAPGHSRGTNSSPRRASRSSPAARRADSSRTPSHSRSDSTCATPSGPMSSTRSVRTSR